MFWSQTLLVTSNIKGHLVGDSFWLYHRHFYTHELKSFITRYEPQKVTIQRKYNITQIKCLSAHSKGKKVDKRIYRSAFRFVTISHDIHYDQTEIVLKMTNELHHGGLTRELNTIKGKYLEAPKQIFSIFAFWTFEICSEHLNKNNCQCFLT